MKTWMMIGIYMMIGLYDQFKQSREKFPDPVCLITYVIV